MGLHRLDLVAIEQFGIDAVQAHGVAPQGGGVHLGIGMAQIDDAALGEHDIVVQVATQSLPTSCIDFS